MFVSHLLRNIHLKNFRKREDFVITSRCATTSTLLSVCRFRSRFGSGDKALSGIDCGLGVIMSLISRLKVSFVPNPNKEEYQVSLYVT